MARERRKYAEGTYLDVEYPFGLYLGGRTLCPDGKVRRIHRIALTADTFFTIPAAVVVWDAGRRYTISGYVSVDDVREGHDVVKFHAYKHNKHGDVLPDWNKEETSATSSTEQQPPQS